MIKKDRTQEQFELFSKGRAGLSARKNLNKNSESLRFVLKADNIIIISISIILAIIFSFSLGVEKGKRMNSNKVAKRSIDARADQGVKIPTAESVKQPIKKTDKSLKKRKTLIGKYAVLVATYKKNSYAEKEAQRLKKEGYETTVVPRGKFIELCVGSFNNRSQAEIARRKLRERYHDCLIRRL